MLFAGIQQQEVLPNLCARVKSKHQSCDDSTDDNHHHHDYSPLFASKPDQNRHHHLAHLVEYQRLSNATPRRLQMALVQNQRDRHQQQQRHDRVDRLYEQAHDQTADHTDQRRGPVEVAERWADSGASQISEGMTKYTSELALTMVHRIAMKRLSNRITISWILRIADLSSGHRYQCLLGSSDY